MVSKEGMAIWYLGVKTGVRQSRDVSREPGFPSALQYVWYSSAGAHFEYAYLMWPMYWPCTASTPHLAAQPATGVGRRQQPGADR